MPASEPGDRPTRPEQPSSTDGFGAPAPRLSPPLLALVGLLLAAPVVALMWVSSYAREDPALFGMPFFYWYQFAWVFIAAATTSIAYQIVVRHERRRRAHTDQARALDPDAGAGR